MLTWTWHHRDRIRGNSCHAVVVTVDVMAVTGHITVDTMGCVTADVTEVTEVVTAGEVTVKYKDGWLYGFLQ